MTKAPQRAVPTLALTEAEAGEALGVSERTMRDLIRAGEIPVVRLGRLVRLIPDDLRAFLERKRGQQG